MGLLDQGLGWRPNTLIPPPVVAAHALPERTDSAATASQGDFYAARLRAARQRQERIRHARTSIHDRDLAWVSTPQDALVAMVISRETGFDPWGIETQMAEIPCGWHTGRHRHGEEAIYIVRGEGKIVVEDRCYDFATGSTIGIPFGATHQLYNTGAEPVRYLSATPFPLEEHLGLSFLEQLEECGPNETMPSVPTSHDGLDSRGRRIRQLWTEARYRVGGLRPRARLEAWLRAGIDLASPRANHGRAAHHAARVASRIGHHGAWVRTMGAVGQMGFPNRLITMSGFLIDEPGMQSGRHAHNEAVLYVARGHGHTMIDGEKVPWEPGSSVHIPGPQTVHQHFNTGGEPVFTLRIVNGLQTPDRGRRGRHVPARLARGRASHRSEFGQVATATSNVAPSEHRAAFRGAHDARRGSCHERRP